MSYTIMLVDDSKTQRAIIKRILGMSEADISEIIEAENGKDALEKLECLKVDIIFSDLNMPVMDGEKMVELIKANDDIKEIPIVIITSKASDAVRINLEKLGVVDYMTKPFTPEDICDVLERLCGGN